MRGNLLKTWVCVAVVSVCGSAYAGPKTGFSVNAGVASHHSKATAYNETYDSSGLSLGIDYQWAINDRFSVLALLMSSAEATSNLANASTSGHALLGVEGRFWAGDVFVGAHVGSYSEALDVGGNSYSSGAAAGWGVTVGWEGAGPWYVVGQVDQANGLAVWSDTNIDLSAVRVSLGYRL